ncbi:MAG TPA: adenylate/guanylate cyclase domain-containing protein [Treponemataceae bacterium]|nr:adenylate/guanylate cyclase domain-containing protein [Treponemataceae bacterium]HQL04700.1 adenylate/guanylate cyclase domain-containing protein [Treponemataceae bacterium]
MENSKKDRILSIAAMLFICSFLGALFALFLRTFVISEYRGPSVEFIILGALTGFIIPLSFHLLSPVITAIKKMPLWVSFFIQPAFFSLIIGLEYGIIIFFTFRPEDFLKNSFLFETIFFSLVISFFVSFFDNLNRLVGKKVLRGLMIGTYHQPVQEERYIMFLDISGSTSIAEKIGDIRFHSLLNNFFSDIAKPVIDNYGDIYKYVGDEVIITWQFSPKTRKFSPIDAYDAICSEIKMKNDYYEKNFGIIPSFKAGLHYGKVVVGEMGSYKQEIALLGDAMNTASRIQSACKPLDSNFLLSKDAVKKMMEQYISVENKSFKSVGEIELRGKEHPMELFIIE